MSTLDVTCSRCEKTFRVRAEFAGKSTRCPGCSAPITIGGTKPPSPVPEPEERPRPRPRRRDDEDDEPRRPAANWVPVDMAFRREQVAVVFVLIGILCDYFAFCLGSSMGSAARVEGVVTALGLLFVIGPALAAAAFGLMARISALRPPPESRARTSAVASLLCGLAGLASLVVMAFTFLLSLEGQRPMELSIAVAVGGLVLATLGALATFLGFAAQIGIARRSVTVSAAVGRMAVAIAVCVLSILGIGILYTLLSEITGPSYRYGPYGNGYYHNHERFYQIMLLFLFPLALGVILILYHRLLAAGRRALQGEPADRYDQ
jgi:hypothetical protein